MDIDSFMNMVRGSIEDINGILKLIIEFSTIYNVSSKYIRYIHSQFIEINGENELLIIGDLHGDVDTLYSILYRENVFEKLEKEDFLVIFLGDYIDRGTSQLETLAAVYILKIIYPDKVIVLRGNHEPDPMLVPYPHDFPYELSHKFGQLWKPIYHAFLSTFQKLPLVVRIPGQAVLLHGGPPSRTMKSKSMEEAFSLTAPVMDDEVLEDILWSDPVDTGIYYSPSHRGAGKLFGLRLTWKLLRLAGVKLIVRGHEAVEGFKFNHRNKVVTVFTSKAPTYGFYEVGYLYVDGPLTPNKVKSYIRTV